MTEIDAKFADFEKDLYKQGIGFGIGTDWILLALTASTTVFGGESTKIALGAASTGVQGAKTSYEKRALFDTALPALLAQMVAQRESIRALIRASEDLAVDSYTLYAAFSDLQRFTFAGSLPGALQSISEDAGQKAKVAKEELKDIRKASYTRTKATDLLMKFWQPDGRTVDATNEARLKQWMTTNGLATGPGSIVMFLYSDVLETARLKAVRDLGLITQ